MTNVSTVLAVILLQTARSNRFKKKNQPQAQPWATYFGEEIESEGGNMTFVLLKKSNDN